MEQSLIDAYTKFINAYSLEVQIDTSKIDRKTYYGNAGSPKRCRFCNKEYKKSSSHLIPKFLGSKYLLSNYECDACNAFFKTYDSDLASFIGPIRSISGIKGSSKNPEYKKGDLALINDEDNNIRIVSKEFVDKIEQGETNIQINVIKDKFVPSQVYKALLKIGLSIVNENDVIHFPKAFKFLFEEDVDFRNLTNSMIIFKIFVPGPPIPESPIIHLFRRKSQTIKVPEKILIIHIKNIKFQICLPFNKLDSHLAGKMLDVPMCPVVLDDKFVQDFGNLQFEQIDLSSNMPVIGKSEGIGLRLKNIRKNSS